MRRRHPFAPRAHRRARPSFPYKDTRSHERRKKFYITTPISYPNGVPHIGHAYKAIATDVSRASSASTARTFLPDRHRRARPQDEADGGQGGPDAARARRPQLARFREMVTALDLSNDDFIRTTESATTSLSRDLAAHGGGWRHLSRRSTPAGTRSATRPITTKRRPSSARTACASRAARDAGRMDGGGDLLLPPVRLSGAAARHYEANPDFIAAARAAERGRELRQGRAEGPVDLAHHARLGHSGSRATEST